MATIIDVHPVERRHRRKAGFVGPATGRKPAARPSWRLIWFAIAVAMACGALGAFDRIASDSSAQAAGPGARAVTGTMPAADFVPRADDLCVAFARRTSTIGFRPDSHASDVADARSRIDALDQTIAVLATMAAPADDPDLVRRTVHDLRGARATAESVVVAGSASLASTRSDLVDPAIAGAFAPLAAHGATRCRF